MITPYVDEKNDIIPEGGQIRMATGADAIAQACRHIVLTVRSECVLDTTRGMPYIETITERQDVPLFLEHARRAWLAIEGVTGVSDVQWRMDGVLRYSAKVATIYGERRIGDEL